MICCSFELLSATVHDNVTSRPLESHRFTSNRDSRFFFWLGKVYTSVSNFGSGTSWRLQEQMISFDTNFIDNMAVGSRSCSSRRHSWSCPANDKTFTIFIDSSINTAAGRNEGPANLTSRLQCDKVIKKRRFSACDVEHVSDTTVFEEAANKIRHLRPRRITESQENFVEWFRKRRHGHSVHGKSIANLDVTGLLDLSGDIFRNIAINQTLTDEISRRYLQT